MMVFVESLNKSTSNYKLASKLKRVRYVLTQPENDSEIPRLFY